MIGIIAPTYKHYIDYIQYCTLDKNNYKYISRLEDVLGCTYDYVIEFNTTYFADVRPILEYLHTRGIEVRRECV